MGARDHLRHAAMAVQEQAMMTAFQDTPQARLLALQRLHGLVDHLSDLVYQANAEQVEAERDETR
jgi:hypothetical protein